MKIPKGQNPFRNLLSAQEAADFLGIRFQSVIEAIVSDRLPAYRWGKSYALKRRDVEAFEVSPFRRTSKTRGGSEDVKRAKAAGQIIDSEPVEVDEAEWERIKRVLKKEESDGRD